MAYTTINKHTDHFNTKLWTGTGSNGNAISGIGFAPDLVWVKNRSETYDHVWFDRIRGDNKHIESNNTSAEENEAYTLAFGSDGYSVGTNTLNKSGNNIASWNWKANGSGSSNTDGSINSTVSVNTTAGFSIVKYTGTGSNATIGHGLGSVPKMIIVKRLSNAENWTTYHTSLGNTKYIDLDVTNASVTYNMWQNYTPTSSVFYITTHNRLNASGDDYIAYCFAEKTGYSKFGSYTGNGSSDGTFVYLGFKPSFLMVKRTDSTSDWLICDNKRNNHSITYPQNNINPINGKLFANLNQAEEFYNSYDFLSNGFKIKTSGTGHNSSGANMIYMAFGQSLVGSNNVPCTAR